MYTTFPRNIGTVCEITVLHMAVMHSKYYKQKTCIRASSFHIKEDYNSSLLVCMGMNTLPPQVLHYIVGIEIPSQQKKKM